MYFLSLKAFFHKAYSDWLLKICSHVACCNRTAIAVWLQQTRDRPKPSLHQGGIDCSHVLATEKRLKVASANSFEFLAEGRESDERAVSELPIQYRSVYHTRHTFISSCLEAGIKVTQVAQWVANSPDTIWRHYAGIIIEVSVPE